MSENAKVLGGADVSFTPTSDWGSGSKTGTGVLDAFKSEETGCTDEIFLSVREKSVWL